MQAKLPHGNGRATEEVPCGFKSSISYQEVDKIEEDWVKKIFESTGRRERSTERNIEVSLLRMPFSPGKTAAFIVFFSPFIFTSGFVRVSTKKTRICRRNSDDTKGDDVYWRQFAKGVDKERVKKVASGKSKGRKKLPKSKNRSNVREKHRPDRRSPRNGA